MIDNEYDIDQNEPVVSIDSLMGDAPSVEKAKNFGKSFKQLLGYSRKYTRLVFMAAILAVCATLFLLATPTLLSDLTNLIENALKGIIATGTFVAIDTKQIVFLAAVLISLYAANGILAFGQGYILATVTQKLTMQMRTDLCQKINKLPMWYYNKNSTGNILSRITNDAYTVGQSLNNSASILIMSITLLIGSVVMMFITNWLMALAAIISTLVGMAITVFIMSKSQKYFIRQQKFLGKINGQVEETYSGHTIVKAYNGEAELREKFIDTNEKLKKSTFKAQCLSGLMMPIMIFIDNFGYVAVSVVGAVLAAQGKISFGVIIAFIMYVRFFTQPITQLVQAAQAMQSATAAAERVFEFLEAEELVSDSGKDAEIANVKGDVEFSHVRFGYEDSEKIVISDFSAKALSGQKIAIVGPTGAGKTTLVNLLMRFNELHSGDIKIDGVSIYDMTRAKLREMFCMVLQDTWLFEGTIRENIIYSKENVTDEQLEVAIKAVGLDHYLRTLPRGYETVLDDKVSLSEGQKQQITIARAMIQNAPMLILDEATSNVDTRTEVHIQQAMDRLMESRTSFVIAHRLSTIKNADLILVLKDGDVIEFGKHNELLERGGFYAELYNSQFEVA